MNEPAQDYAAEDTEEVVLTRWDKIKQWIEIAVATKKVAMFVWSLVFGVGGTAIYGEVTDTKPFKRAAIEVGLIEAAPIDTTKGMLQDEFINQLATLQQEITDLKAHQHNYPDPPAPLMKDHSHPLKKHGHPVSAAVPAHDHPEYITQKDAPVVDDAHLTRLIKKEVEALLPPNHRKLH